jgi:hypothetical protein
VADLQIGSFALNLPPSIPSSILLFSSSVLPPFSLLLRFAWYVLGMRIRPSRVFLFLAALLSSSYCVPQELTKLEVVAITVRDANGSVVADADVAFGASTDTSGKSQKTNAQGLTTFELRPATYVLTVTARGFRSLKRQVIVSPGAQQPIDIGLEVLGECLPENCIIDTVWPAVPISTEDMRNTRNIDITDLRLLGQQNSSGKGEPLEIKEFRELKNGRMAPGMNFDVVCELTGELDLSSDDFLVWSTIDFLVAPTNASYQRMNVEQLSEGVVWGQVTEMLDIKSAPIYSLRGGESRSVRIKNFSLQDVLALFHRNDTKNLWPWLLRVNIHVQDRTGRQIASATRIVRIRPEPSRIQKDQ